MATASAFDRNHGTAATCCCQGTRSIVREPGQLELFRGSTTNALGERADVPRGGEAAGAWQPSSQRKDGRHQSGLVPRQYAFNHNPTLIKGVLTVCDA